MESKDLKEEMKKLNEDEIINELKTKYPVAYEFLISSRDLFIAFKILKLIKDYPNKNIVVFVGKGHERGIMELLKWMKTLNEINTIGMALFFLVSEKIVLASICILLSVLVRIKGGEGSKLRDLRKKWEQYLL